MKNKDLVWLVAYTKPKNEKKAYEKLQQMGITTFLPLYERLQLWSDRKKKVLFPLFPNYIFIQTTLSHRFIPLQLKELVSYVSFGGNVAHIREEEIETLKKIVQGSTSDLEVSHQEFQKKGQPVKVVKGPLAGLKGIVHRVQSKNKLLISIRSLKQNISLEVPAGMLKEDHVNMQT